MEMSLSIYYWPIIRIYATVDNCNRSDCAIANESVCTSGSRYVRQCSYDKRIYRCDDEKIVTKL